jgi:D-lyxose ketol-isomerase
LDDGLRLAVLKPGDQLELPPGTYRLTLAGEEGLVAVPSVVLIAEVDVDLSDLVSP